MSLARNYIFTQTILPHHPNSGYTLLPIGYDPDTSIKIDEIDLERGKHILYIGWIPGILKIIQNDTDIAWELNNVRIENRLFNFCVGKTVGGSREFRGHSQNLLWGVPEFNLMYKLWRVKGSTGNEYVLSLMSHLTHVNSLFSRAKWYVLIWFKYFIPLTCLKSLLGDPEDIQEICDSCKPEILNITAKLDEQQGLNERLELQVRDRLRTYPFVYPCIFIFPLLFPLWADIFAFLIHRCFIIDETDVFHSLWRVKGPVWPC